MRRYFFIADNLEDVEKVETSMKAQGFVDDQYRVLSNSDSAAEKRKLHDVSSIFKRDVIHSGEIGALVGLAAASVVILLAWLTGWHSGDFGWVPYITLAILTFCFCTWEGAFLGFQIPHSQFKRFNKQLAQGKHVFFVDLSKEELPRFEKVLKLHPELHAAGTGMGTPAWFVKSSHNFKEALKALP